MLQNKTNFKKNVHRSYEINNLEKGKHKKWLGFYRHENHTLFEINQVLK